MPDLTMPPAPAAVLEAERRLMAAHEALAERADEVDREVERIKAERAKLAVDWPAPEQRLFREQQMSGAERGVKVAERGVGRAREENREEWAPGIAETLEAAISITIATVDKLEAELEHVAQLRALLDVLERAPLSTRGIAPRMPNGRLKQALTELDPRSLASTVRLMATQARPAERARLIIGMVARAEIRDRKLAALQAAQDYAAVRAAIDLDEPGFRDSEASSARW